MKVNTEEQVLVFNMDLSIYSSFGFFWILIYSMTESLFLKSIIGLWLA